MSSSSLETNAAGGDGTAIVAISRNGAGLARQLASGLAGSRLYLERRYAANLTTDPARVTPFDLPLRPVLERLFRENRRLVLFMPVGAAVRLLAPSLQHKHNDPAVVCVDDAGRFAVSLLSGHVGGADELADAVAGIIGAAPVITSASRVLNTLAVDLLGQDFGWRIEADSETITRVSASVVNGEPVAVFQDAGERDWLPAGVSLPANLTLYPSIAALAQFPAVAALLITDRLLAGPELDALQGKRLVIYRPRSLAVGLGCRRGVTRQHLEDLLLDVFRRQDLSPSSLACLATAEIKHDEPGILELARQYGVPAHFYPAEELNRAFVQTGAAAGPVAPTPSAARRLLGVWGVAEPAALLSAGAGALLAPRQKTDRATLAVARITNPSADEPAIRDSDSNPPQPARPHQ